MSAIKLLIGLILAGQVSPPPDRYNFPSGGQAAPKNSVSGAPAGTGRIQEFGQPPQNEPASRGSVLPIQGNVDPYAPRSDSPAATGQRSSPPRGFAPPPGFDAARAPFADSIPQTGANATNTAPAQSQVGLKPSAMMRAMLSPPADSQLSGSSVRLLDVVAGAKTRLEQSQRVEAYWDLCSSVADYYLALDERAELQRLRSMLQRVGPTWEQAESELAVRLGTSQRAALALQLRLAGWLGRGPASLPLPVDPPHCGSYHTRYEEIFAGRPIAEAQELATLLPLRYAELKNAATAVTRAEDWIKTVASKDSDGTGTLTALEFLALRRRAFVQIARDYNRRIARYAELSTPGEIGAERLVGMLIKLDASSTATRPASTGAQPGRQSRSANAVPPQTFADSQGWEPANGVRPASRTRDESVVPASGNSQPAPRREHSLLVAPQ